MEIGTFALTVLIIYIFAYIIAGGALLVTYRRYRYVVHAWMFVAFTLLFSHYLFRIYAVVVPTDLTETVWFLQNVTIMLGLWALLLASIRSQYDRLPIRSNWISLLVGLLIALFSDPDNVVLTYDEFGLNASYAPIVGLFSVTLTLLFLVFITRPLLIRLKKSPASMKEPYFLSLMLAYTLIFLWAIGVAFTSNPVVRNYRPLVLGVALFFWGISIYLNPLSLSLTPTRVKTFLIATHSGIPVISLDTLENKEKDMTLLMPLISAVKVSMESLVSSAEGELSTIHFQDSLLTFVKGKRVLLIMELLGNFSSNIELMSKVYLKEFEENYDSVFETMGDAVEPGLFASENFRILHMINSITQ